MVWNSITWPQNKLATRIVIESNKVMKMYEEQIFYIGVSLLLTHELDAIARHEWRMFPFICRLKDDIGYKVFVMLHIPLLVCILWFMSHPSDNMRYWFQVSIDIFLILHLGLHHLLRSHHKNEFTSTFSRLLIGLAAFSGLVHLILLV